MYYAENNMPKTSFSKSELNELYRIIIKEKMFPLLDIRIYFDPFNSGVNCNYHIISFSNENKEVRVGFITRTESKIEPLRKQLIDYFIKNRIK